MTNTMQTAALGSNPFDGASLAPEVATSTRVLCGARARQAAKAARQADTAARLIIALTAPADEATRLAARLIAEREAQIFTLALLSRSIDGDRFAHDLLLSRAR